MSQTDKNTDMNPGVPEAFLSYREELSEVGEKAYALGVSSPIVLPQMCAVPSYAMEGVPAEQFAPVTDPLADEVVALLSSRKDKIFEYQTVNIFRCASAARAIRVPESEEYDAVKISSEQEHDAADVFVVSLGAGSKIDLELVSKGGVLGRTLIILAEEDATATVRWSASNALCQNVIVIQKRNSHVTLLDATMPGKQSLSHVSAFIGESAEFIMRGVYLGGQDSQMDNRVVAFHEGNDSTSDIRTYGVLAGNAHITQRTLVDIPTELHDVSGNEDGRFLVLSKNARIDAIPALDIASGQVSCAHALAIDTIDDMELFYPLLRGISEEEARELLIRAVLIQGVTDLPERAAHKFGGRIGLGISELHV